jgi:hypothetical protein
MPAIGLTIIPASGAAVASDDARRLHAGHNRGAMLSIDYWCEHGCQGRFELRSHKGNLFASLHNEPPMQPDDFP